VASVTPATPGTITQTLLSNNCGARVYRYSVPAVAGLWYRWSFTPSVVGARIDSGSIGNAIIVTFTSAAASNAPDSIRVFANAGCLSSLLPSKLKLALTACSLPAIARVDESQNDKNDKLDAVVFPNPTTSTFKLSVKASDMNGQVHVRILDIQGREYKRTNMMPGEVITMGSDLRAGTYMIQVLQGKKSRVLKLIKL
jgi:hypothetical protein